MAGILATAAMLLIITLVAGRKTAARVYTAIGSQLNKLGRYVWGFDPIAVYQKQVDDATVEIQSGVRGLEEYRSHMAKLQRKIDTTAKEIEVLQVRAEGFVRQGNDGRAADTLVEKKRLEYTLAQDRSSLATCESTYNTNLIKIQYARQRIDSAKKEAQRLQVDLRMSKAEAEIAKLSTNITSSSLDGLGEVRDEIQRQIDANRAVAQVSQDLGDNGLLNLQAAESHQRAEATSELVALKAKIGVPSNN